ncbi:hypothetical protein AAC387_Pa02g0854 [Persea americana]|eukprot:TRINITY_DN5353_c0_g1_i1.p1 TRINITY_DN5353_c0_g1~~TRINITY_DN5353_c0_g1_i1.p1  ORF type:complete len:258 (+),score=18.40 TRINITY_DN5353_c0_g1_i1:304-1077(+)
MDPFRSLLLLSSLFSVAAPHSILQISPGSRRHGDRSAWKGDELYCDSWRFSVETNDAGIWTQVPERCVGFVREYMTGERYASDCGMVSNNSMSFAGGVKIAGDGKDAWIFDIDETLLSNLPYYAAHGFGSEVFDETAYNEWANLADAPAIPASLMLYNVLKRLKFKLILLTGRTEVQRNATAKNLLLAGYSNWERLILRGIDDVGKPALVYKSHKRAELEGEGYRIHGNSGDQWSDLLGMPVATRSFKLPNPMYYIE